MVTPVLRKDVAGAQWSMILFAPVLRVDGKSAATPNAVLPHPLTRQDVHPVIQLRLPSTLARACLALLAMIGLGTQSAVAFANGNGQLCSPGTQENLEVEFVNNSSQPVSFHWMQFDCTEGGGPSLAPGQREKGTSHPGHIYLARGAGEQILRIFKASADDRAFVVDDALIARVAKEGEPYTEGRCSPKTDGRFSVEFVNHLNEPITMQWIGFDCEVHVLSKIPARGKTSETTFPGHVFRFVDSTGRQLATIDVASGHEQPYHVSAD
jgi:hypothetical protein